MAPHWHESPGWLVVDRAMRIAAETHEVCRPVHLLAALAELDGPIGDALRPPPGVALVPRPADPPEVHGGSTGYLVSQTQQAAYTVARDPRAGGGVRPEEHPPAVLPGHLLVALIDQAEPEVLAAMARAGLDAVAVRRVALDLLGAAPDLPSIPMPPLLPAGTSDRPALPVEQLDGRAWSVLRWRQEHLPLDRIRRAGNWEAMSSLEGRAVWRVADHLGLDDNQRYSLLKHHHTEVERLAHAAKPGLVETRQQLMDRHPGTVAYVSSSRSFRRRLVPGFMVGWPTWFANRRVGLRNRWWRMVTLPAYRGQPSPRTRA